MEYVIGVDLGTGSMKTVLFDRDGREIAELSQEYPTYSLHNGWSEQDPEDWYNATVQTIRYVMADSGVNPGDVKGIGISGQMMGAIVLDKRGELLRRAILWNDSRTTKARDSIAEIVGDEVFQRITLNPARPGLTAAKVQWIKENEPEIFSQVEHILLPKDYLRYRLTGDFATEVSDASATQWLDVSKRQWSEEIIRELGLRPEQLGEVYESQEVTGTLLPDVADLMGLTQDCVVVGGAGDNAAAGVGTGVVAPGRAMTTIGTSGTVFAYTDKPLVDPRIYTFCMAVPGAWHFMGSVNSAGNSLKWYRNNFYPQDTEYKAINADVAASQVGANRLIYLPYLTGEQSPHFDLNCRAGFIGLSANHTKADMSRAVMEGITYAMKDVMAAIEDTGIHPEVLRLCGGGSKSAFWRQLVADIYDIPVVLPDMNSENSAALGVAILAAVGAGLYPSVVEACDHIVRLRAEQYQPNRELVPKYAEVYKAYGHLYPQLKDNFYEILHMDIK